MEKEDYTKNVFHVLTKNVPRETFEKCQADYVNLLYKID